MSALDDFDKLMGSQPAPQFALNQTYGTPPQVLDNLQQTESSGKPYAINSTTKAMGPYQFTPETVASLHQKGVKFDPFDPAQARTAADYYLSTLAQQNGGDWSKAVAAYGGFKTKDPSAYVGKVLGSPAQTTAQPQGQTLADFDKLMGSPAQAGSEQPAQTPSGPAPDVHPGAVNKIPGNNYPQPTTPPEPSLWDKAVGAGEAALTTGTGLVGGLVGQAYGAVKALSPSNYGTAEGSNRAADAASRVSDLLTYHPRTAVGQEDAAAVGKVLQNLPAIPGDQLLAAGALSKPAMAQLAERAKTPFGGLSTPTPPSNSVGAAGATLDSRMSQASPELQAAYGQAKAKGPVNPVAAENHLTADSLPVPIRLTEGQATGNIHLLSQEQNMRGAVPELADRFARQNGDLKANILALRDEAAPDHYGSNMVDHGREALAGYARKDEALQANINAKYQALRDANGGDFPVDAPTLLSNTQAALKKELLTNDAPSSQMAELSRMATEGSMSMEDYLSLRRNLGNVARTAQDGNTRMAASIMIQKMEELPLQGGAAELKPLADDARAAAKARFDMIDADPAYKAYVNGTVSPDDFIKRFVVGGKQDNVRTMMQNLGGDDQARQAIAAGTVDWLRDSAGVDSVGNGNFGQSRYNKSFNAIRPIVSDVVPAPVVQKLDALGQTARLTQAQPRGSYVNNSNTLVGSLATGAKKLIVHGADAVTGIPTKGLIRGGSIIEQFFARKSAENQASAALQPGAGLLKSKRSGQ